MKKTPTCSSVPTAVTPIKLQSGDEIMVSYGGASTNLIQLAEQSYFSLLRNKLAWGKGSKRGPTGTVE
jgi:hypothetical protein